MVLDDRFERQVRIGWDQSKITNATVAVLGNNSLFIDLFLTFLGFNHVLYVTQDQNTLGNSSSLDNSSGTESVQNVALGQTSGQYGLATFGDDLLGISLNAQKGRKAGKGTSFSSMPLEHLSKTLNPDSKAVHICSSLSGSHMARVIGHADIILETRQDASLRDATLYYAHKLKKPAVFLSNQGNAALVHTYIPGHTDFSDSRQKSFFMSTKGEGFMPLLLFGMSAYACGEVVRQTLGLGASLAYPNTPVMWNLAGRDKFWYNTDYQFTFDKDDFAGKRILQIGAGGTGVSAAYLIAAFLQPEVLYVVDYDTVELTNLNRQFLYYDPSSVGKKKVDVAQKVLGNLGRTKIVGIDACFDEGFELSSGETTRLLGKIFTLAKPSAKSTTSSTTKPSTRSDTIDLVLDCSSGFDNRLRIQNYAVEHGLPLISVGADAYNSDVHVYKPGMAPCFECQFGIYQKALFDALVGRRPGCDLTPEGSNIVTTAFGASLAVGMIPSVLMPEKYGDHLVTLNYRLKHPERAWVDQLQKSKNAQNAQKGCSCSSRHLELPGMERVRFVGDADAEPEIYIDGQKLER